MFFNDLGELQVNSKRPFLEKLDSLPMPDRELFPKKLWERGDTSLITSRGCPYKCSFCQVTAEWRRCRYHSAEYVLEEIKGVVEKFNIHTFGVVDDLFITKKQRIRQIICGLKEMGLHGKVRFAVNGRANLINDELVELLIEMGTAEIALGLESMSPRILTLLKDKVTVEDNIRAVETIYKHGLKTGGLFMVGTPTETIDDLEATYTYVKQNRHKFGGMQVCITTPLPNTPLWDMAVERKIIDPDIDKFPWGKLNIAAEDINTNLYIGDIDRDLFIKIMHKFRILFFQPTESNAKEKKGGNKVHGVLFKSISMHFDRMMTFLKKVFSRKALSLLINDPKELWKKIIQKTKPYVLNFSRQEWIEDPCDYLYDSAINPRNIFQHGLADGSILIEENGEPYYQIPEKTQFRLIGLFNSLAISYKTNGNAGIKDDILKIKVGDNVFDLTATNGEIKEIIFPLGNRHNNRRGVKIIEMTNLRKDIQFFLGKLEVDFINARRNYIKPGENDFEQVGRGSYPVEFWTSGNVFWTKYGYIEFFLAPSGKESSFEFTFLSGEKKNKNDAYVIEVALYRDDKKAPLAERIFEVPQKTWCHKELPLPSMNGLKLIKGVIKSDYFNPKELNLSEDIRNLGIAVSGIFLK